MCTVSWSFKEHGYRLYFNRDEQRSRVRAELPRLIEWQGVEMISPIDPKGGGSWIALNSNGVVAFVLNNYAATSTDDGSRIYKSRGEIPLSVASKLDFDSSAESIGGFGNEDYRPFLAGVVSPAGESCVISWDGVGLERLELDSPFVTTSSYRSKEVESYRHARYEELKASGGSDWAWSSGLSYHQDLGNPDPAFNPVMSREDAETHCISVISVTSGKTEFEYLERLANRTDFSHAGNWSFGD